MQTNPVKCIRLKCLDCSGGSIKDVELCTIPDCALFPFRMGKNPYRQKIELNAEQKKELAIRLKKGRESNKSTTS